MGNQRVIETEGLTKVYNGQVAVDQLSFTLAEGEVFGFLGPNGAGKTTTLLMLLGLTEPSSGKAEVLGIDPTRQPIKVKGMIGYLPENTGFYGDLDAVQSLQYIADLNGMERGEAEERIQEALNVVGLSSDTDKKVGAYSRGMSLRSAGRA